MTDTNKLKRCHFETGGWFHQHFTRAFFVQKYSVQLSLITFKLCNFWCQNIGAKCERKMLMKFTPVRLLVLHSFTSNVKHLDLLTIVCFYQCYYYEHWFLHISRKIGFSLTIVVRRSRCSTSRKFSEKKRESWTFCHSN